MLESVNQWFLNLNLLGEKIISFIKFWFLKNLIKELILSLMIEDNWSMNQVSFLDTKFFRYFTSI